MCRYYVVDSDNIKYYESNSIDDCIVAIYDMENEYLNPLFIYDNEMGLILYV